MNLKQINKDMKCLNCKKFTLEKVRLVHDSFNLTKDAFYFECRNCKAQFEELEGD